MPGKWQHLCVRIPAALAPAVWDHLQQGRARARKGVEAGGGAQDAALHAWSSGLQQLSRSAHMDLFKFTDLTS